MGWRRRDDLRRPRQLPRAPRRPGVPHGAREQSALARLLLVAPFAGLALAVLLQQACPACALVRTLFFMPFVISQVIVGLVFGWFFNTRFGLLNGSWPRSASRRSRRSTASLVALPDDRRGAVAADRLLLHPLPDRARHPPAETDRRRARRRRARLPAVPSCRAAAASRHPLHRRDGLRSRRAAQLRLRDDHDAGRPLRQLDGARVLHVRADVPRAALRLRRRGRRGAARADGRDHRHAAVAMFRRERA